MNTIPDTPQNAAAAIAVQEALRHKVSLIDATGELECIAGIDVGYDNDTNTSYAVIVMMQINELDPHAMVRAERATEFPYVPGLLSFREIPVVMSALEKLPRRPDLLMVDGQGIAHPRRLGIAAHLGVLTDIPAIGVAKSRLIGSYETLGDAAGSTSPLLHRGERIGTVLRSKRGCLPLFVSPGHRVSHERAVQITLHCLKGYRLPEPTRIADKFSKSARRGDGLEPKETRRRSG